MTKSKMIILIMNGFSCEWVDDIHVIYSMRHILNGCLHIMVNLIMNICLILV